MKLLTLLAGKAVSFSLLFLLFFFFGSTKSFSQTKTTINYKKDSLSTTACNVFPINSVAVSGITHSPLAGGVSSVSGQGIVLTTNPSSTTPGGTAYVINYNFLSGYKYDIAITTTGGDGSMNLFTSVVSSLSSFPTHSNTACSPDNDVLSYRRAAPGDDEFTLIPFNAQTNKVPQFTQSGSSTLPYLVIWVTGGSTNLDLDAIVISEVDITQTAPASPPPPPPTCSLPAPTNLTNTNNGVTLNWDPVSGATSYSITWLDQFPNNGSITGGTISSPTNSVNFCPLGANHSVSFTVKAVCANGIAGAQSTQDSYIYTPQPLATPAAVTFTAPTTLSWSAVPGATRYLVEVMDLATGGIGPFIVTGTSVSDPDAELSFNHSYQVRVTAQGCTNSAAGPWSNSFTVLAPCPNPNIANVEVLGAGQANIAWNTVAGADTYNFEFVGTTTTTFSNVSGTLHSGHTFTGIPAGSYTVSIQANCNVGNQSPWIAYFSQVTVSSNGKPQAQFMQGNVDILDPEAIISFRLYPVPSSSLVTVLYNAGESTKADIVIVSEVGTVVIHKAINAVVGSNTYLIDVSRLANGLYIVKLTDGKSIYIQKLLIQK